MSKRLFDLAILVLTLPLWLPVGLATALCVWLKLGRPIFFRQLRPGCHGSPFYLIKFRTMLALRDQHGRLLPDGDRLTPFSRWLRSTSLDELPEFINVLRGDMSLVGPRPLRIEYLPRYSLEQARRHEVLPGITGWAQVNGRNAISWEEKFQLDLYYVDHHSIGLDIKILVLTMIQLWQRRGIEAPGHATMPEFMGNQPEDQG